MKKIILLISVCFAISIGKGRAQTDTLGILQNIIANKATYIGQPFSVLLNQLPLQIKYFSPSRGPANNRYAESSTQFAFYFPFNYTDLYRTRPCLLIFWEPMLNRSSSVALYTPGKGAWSSTIATHYGSAIVADIILQKP